MTGIRSLDNFITESGLTRSVPLATLQNATIGVSAGHFVSQLLSVLPSHREPLLHATGGFPLTLELALSKLKEVFASVGISPLFVFDGLCMVQTARHPSYEEARWSRGSRAGMGVAMGTVRQHRDQAWDLYKRGQGEQAVIIFDEAETFNLRTDYGMRQMIGLLIKHDIEFMVAPYTASAQLAYLYSEQFVDAIYASNDVLLFEAIDTLILSLEQVLSLDINPKSDRETIKSRAREIKVSYMSRLQLLSQLGMVSHQQFMEMGLACGCDLTGLTTLPIIESSIASTGMNAMRVAQGLIQSSPAGSLLTLVMAMPDNQTDVGSTPYPIIFQRALASVLFQPVLKESGKVEAIGHVDQVPSDMHEFIGQRLPDELYFYMSRGLIGPELLDALTSGVLYEYAPMDGGSSKLFQDFMVASDTVSNTPSSPSYTRSAIFSYLVQYLHRYYQFKSLEYVTWFGKDVAIPKINPPLYKTIGITWRLTEDKFKSMKLHMPSTISQALILMDENPENSIFSSDIAAGSIKFSGGAEVMINVFYRTLQTLDFIDDNHALTGWGVALASGLSKLERNKGTLFSGSDQLIVLSCLLRQVQYTTLLDSISSSNDNGHIALISQIASHISLHHNPVGYTGPLSRELLGYGCFVAEQTKLLRQLTEAITASLFLNGNTNRTSWSESSKWTELVRQLPFVSTPNTGTGIAVKFYLQELTSASNPSDDSAAIEAIKSMFSQASNIRQDIYDALSFWDAFVDIIRRAPTGLISKAFQSRVSDADIWLKSYRT